MLNQLKKHLTNIPGWRTNRQIVIIESDDWGSIRMPSKKVKENLLKAGIPVDQCPYNKYDTLAGKEDLSRLFETLEQFKDINGKHPSITANTVVANPDFEKIKASGFNQYYFEPFTETQKKYPGCENAFKLWKQGMRAGIFFPQFHGREHLNVRVWLRHLQNAHPWFRTAFDHQLWGFGKKIIKDQKINIQAAFDAENHQAIDEQRDILKEGLDLFEKTFGYRSKSFIANNFIWDSGLNQTLAEKGVRILQGMKYQKTPILHYKKRKLIRHRLGEINPLGQVHLIRNCSFEPSQYPEGFDSIGRCLKEISIAFLWKKPALISAHRLNFIGSLVRSNREQNLEKLSVLIKQIQKQWPDVEFMNSVELGDLIIREK